MASDLSGFQERDCVAAVQLQPRRDGSGRDQVDHQTGANAIKLFTAVIFDFSE
jgi:hypothetical protein